MTTMIYTEGNRYAIVEDDAAAAYIASGWSATPLGDIYSEPAKYTGGMTLPDQSKPPKKGQ